MARKVTEVERRKELVSNNLHVYTDMYVHTDTCIRTSHVHVLLMHIIMYGERGRGREGGREGERERESLASLKLFTNCGIISVY